MKFFLKVLIFGALAALVGCQPSGRLTISGVIDNAAGDTLTIKQLVSNKLQVVDTKVLKNSGSFKFSLEKQQYPEYYFLQVNNGNQLVVIRDSSDHIELTANGAIKDATIEGSEVSSRIQTMMHNIGDLRVKYAQFLKDSKGLDVEAQNVLTETFIAEYNAVKDEIGKEIYKDPKSYYSYYALYQRLNADNLLFSPYDEKDYKYYAVVATSYDLYHKEDPRTKALYEMVEGVIADRRAAKMQQMVAEASSVLPDIAMNDVKGVERKLSDLKGKVVILNFWASKSEESRVLNQDLKVLYKKYKSKGLAVYQVSADKSKILWEMAIEKDELPWVNVCDFKEGASRPLMIYNVKQVPTTFLVAKDGSMINRFTSTKDLEAAIKKAL